VIYRIVYISKSTVAPVSEAVSNIARKSLSRNMQLGITGFLYFDEKMTSEQYLRPPRKPGRL
ncbi:MAG: BLUF domain-containing protein, partial [Pseudomonadota bacterium]